MGRPDRQPNGETAVTAAPKRCVIYARCSTRDQDTENQLAQLRDYAARQEWVVVTEVVDVCSGGKDAKDR